MRSKLIASTVVTIGIFSIAVVMIEGLKHFGLVPESVSIYSALTIMLLYKDVRRDME
jgi:hypothetical protein